jgi:hypothetical protein
MKSWLNRARKSTPMSMTDPSGYFGMGDLIRDLIAVGFAYATAGMASPLLDGTLVGAAEASAVAFVGGYATGAIQTGSSRGALQGAVSSLVFFGVEAKFGGRFDLSTTEGVEAYAEHALISGVAGGVLAQIQGGRFGNGFISAGFSAAVNPLVDGAVKNESGAGFLETIIGGTASKLGGGSFANGAISASFAYAFERIGTRVDQDGSPVDLQRPANNDERAQFAADNQFTLTSALGQVAGKFPGLAKYLDISNEDYVDKDGYWFWNQNTKSIQVNSMITSGDLLLTNQAALILVAHEAIHGLVYNEYDANYRARAIWHQLVDTMPPYSPNGGRPHLWVDNKGIAVGNWINDSLRTPQPNLSSESYWGCVNGGGCK